MREHPNGPGHDDVPWELLTCYLSGECNPEERQELESWLAAHPEQEPVVSQFRRSWQKTATPIRPPMDVAKLERSVVSRIESRAMEKSPRANVGNARRSLWHLAWIIPIVALLGVKYLPDFSHNTPTSGNTVTGAFRTYTTVPGQRATLALVDGSKIILNVASRLRVPQGFGTAHRNLELEGEAQFVVQHDKKLPFVVNANGTLIRDLATTFVVRTYRGDGQITVVVRDGKVAVQAPTLTNANSVTVTAGQLARVTLDGVPELMPAKNMDTYFSWTDGKLVMRDMPLGHALVTLTRWYGREFRVADSTLLSSRITTVLPEQFDAARIQRLADIMGARAAVDGNVVTLFER